MENHSLVPSLEIFLTVHYIDIGLRTQLLEICSFTTPVFSRSEEGKAVSSGPLLAQWQSDRFLLCGSRFRPPQGGDCFVFVCFEKRGAPTGVGKLARTRMCFWARSLSLAKNLVPRIPCLEKMGVLSGVVVAAPLVLLRVVVAAPLVLLRVVVARSARAPCPRNAALSGQRKGLCVQLASVAASGRVHRACVGHCGARRLVPLRSSRAGVEGEESRGVSFCGELFALSPCFVAFFSTNQPFVSVCV